MTSFKPLNMFISYSHEDKVHLDNLKKHLISLKRNDVIKEWDDKELIVGDKLDEEIKNRLLEADLVAFLISVDFLNSYYCFDIELEETIKRLDNYNLRIIPIIVRQCEWKDSKLGNYVAIPEDGKAVESFDRHDEAWSSIVKEIKKAAKKLNEKRGSGTYLKGIEKNESAYSLLDSFQNELISTEIVFQHSHKDKISLDDIFVYPDLKALKQEYDDMEISVSSGKLAEYNYLDEKTLLLGDEQVGKTALIKILFKKYYSKGIHPLIVNGANINKTELRKVFNPAVREQYDSIEYSDFISSKKQKILFIDDFHTTKLNDRFQRKFLDLAEEAFDKVIIVADQSLKYIESEYISFSDYTQYEILAFGHQRRSDLINKWNTLGREETIDIKELHTLNDVSKIHVDSIIRKNIVPRKPVYILAILQSLEIAKPTDYGLTSYGHCYQYLIQQTLHRARIRSKDLDTYINYLTELAYFIYEKGGTNLEESLLGEFREGYSSKFLIDSHERVLNVLIESRILKSMNNKIEFGYKYIFYFYVAKYLADHLNSKNCKSIIENLCEKIHTEKNANILIFLVHHSKDQNIIDDILLCTSLIFDDVKEATLDADDTSFLIEFIESIPELVIEQRNVEEERQKDLKEKDRNEGFRNDSEKIEEDFENINEGTFAEINRSARAVDVIGQILRNRIGSLTKDQLYDLTMSARSVGLRFLKFYLNLSKNVKDDIINLIGEIIRDNSTLSDEDIVKEARQVYLTICYGVSYAVIQKIANSLGSEQLIPIFEELSQKNPKSPAIELIDIAIKLEFTTNIPKKEIKELFGETESNVITNRMLQEVVLQHLYLHYIDYKDKQWISDTLKIPMQAQRLIEKQEKLKKMDGKQG